MKWQVEEAVNSSLLIFHFQEEKKKRNSVISSVQIAVC